MKEREKARQEYFEGLKNKNITKICNGSQGLGDFQKTEWV